VLQLLATANVVSNSLIVLTLTMEAICSSEVSVLARATQRPIPEDGILNTNVYSYLMSQIMRGIYESIPHIKCDQGKLHLGTATLVRPDGVWLLRVVCLADCTQSRQGVGRL
jgi:hypothetical protein